METIDKTKQLPTLIDGKKLERVDAPISTLPECLAALAAGYWLESENGFHFLQGDMFVYADNFGAKPTLSIAFYFQPFVAAYRLVDEPWWENIPSGGVLCEYINIPDGEVLREYISGCWLGIVTDIKINKSICGVIGGNEYEIENLKPVTDEWLESMKRGY